VSPKAGNDRTAHRLTRAMNESPDENSFLYEHCDVPQGQSLAEWRTTRARAPRRRPQVTSGMFAALTALAPNLLRQRDSDSH
jgi:hypothetical protein